MWWVRARKAGIFRLRWLVWYGLVTNGTKDDLQGRMDGPLRRVRLDEV